MGNPFEGNSSPWVEFTDDPDGKRILLDCQYCGKVVTKCRYNQKKNLLQWYCESCSNKSEQEFVL